MMKFAGLTVLTLSIALTGIYISAAERKKAEILQKISLFFYEMRRLCQKGSYTIEEVFRKTACMNELQGLDFPVFLNENFSSGENLKSLWLQAVSYENKSLSRKARDSLSAFSEEFGKESREGFCSRCLYYGELFEDEARKEKAKWEKNREITVYTGILAAAAVFFIFM